MPSWHDEDDSSILSGPTKLNLDFTYSMIYTGFEMKEQDDTLEWVPMLIPIWIRYYPSQLANDFIAVESLPTRELVYINCEDEDD